MPPRVVWDGGLISARLNHLDALLINQAICSFGKAGMAPTWHNWAFAGVRQRLLGMTETPGSMVSLACVWPTAN